ncbi:mucin-2 [Streptomyces sp. CA-250714]|uniref:mucin-2 n=1 Tax=Streptomyces sp. CA-250714 TaxID=3240060 RepID=UPI003D938FE9
MPWFKVDDTAHAHPKLLKAGNAALGLWMRVGAYCAQHLTEGAVPGVVAQLYGTAPQARKLVTAGLWHEHGHTCPRCPQPAPGDYQMHDFLTYNPTREKTEQKRAAAAERQQRARERSAEQRNQERNPPDSSANRPRIDDDSSGENREPSANQIEFPDDIAGQKESSHRDGTGPSRSPRPDPTRPLVLPSEVQQQQHARERSGLVPELHPLADALAAAGCGVRWSLGLGEQRDVHQLVKTHGADALAEVVTRRTAPGDDPKPARYWLKVWADPRTWQTAPGADVIPLDRGARPSTTDQRVAAGMDLAARLRAQEAAQ